jgi:hypothetical protein
VLVGGVGFGGAAFVLVRLVGFAGFVDAAFVPTVSFLVLQ